jgi:hypothetical protein
MAVKTKYQDALKKLGLICVEYRVEVEEPSSFRSGETWLNCLATGIALQRNGEDWRVIEHVPTGWGGDGKWRVYGGRSVGEVELHREQLNNEVEDTWEEARCLNVHKCFGVAKTQREALAIAVKSL